VELAKWLGEAWTDYQRTWAVVDAELYDLCARRGHDRLEDVYAKVAVINRVYAAGLSRSVRVPGVKDPEMLVAETLLSRCRLVAGGLAGIEGSGALSNELLGSILDLHWEVQVALEERVGRRLTSFVSKYLHFHLPYFPIYDNLAWRAIGDVTRDQFGRPSASSTSLPAGAKGDEYYRSYCTRFWAVFELAKRSGVDVSVKMLDHALWSHGQRLAGNPG
jgi:hypothetical protein